MPYYNKDYTYPDMFLWQDETYRGCMNAAGPLFLKLQELLEKEPHSDHFPERTDLVTDAVNHMPYFPDYVKEWEEKGMYFSCSGMMGEVMAPRAVKEHRVKDAAVLYIPYAALNDPKQGMNLIADNAELLEQAARDNILVQFADCKASFHGAMIEKVIESQGTFRIHYKPILLDISALIRHGLTTADVPGLNSAEWQEPFLFAGRMVVDITDKLEMKQAHQHNISEIYRRDDKRWHWNFDRHIRTLAAKRQAEGMHLEVDSPDAYSLEMQAFWQERGIRYEDHDRDGDWYITLTPTGKTDAPDEKLPLFVVMKEPRTACKASTQTAFQFYYDFIELCAQGQFMMLFFALETPEDNDEVLPGIIDRVCEQYPVDPTRIYLTGQSHNGHYALEFYRRHPKMIAACAQLCDSVGLKSGAVIDYYLSRADELIESFRQYTYPDIVINGSLENSYRNADRNAEQAAEDVRYFRNRMAAWRLHPYTDAEILGAQHSPDYATRMNGVPADRTEVRFIMGDEVYVSDYFTQDGINTFRYASIENTPHMIMPQMAELSWEFCRRFARNRETGESIVRY